MLDKKHRLSKNVSFKNSKIFSSTAFILKIRSLSEEYSGFAIVISKRIDKRATERNRIKRQIRNSIEEILPEIKKASQVLIIAKPGIRSLSFLQTRDSLEELFRKAKIL